MTTGMEFKVVDTRAMALAQYRTQLLFYDIKVAETVEPPPAAIAQLIATEVQADFLPEREAEQKQTRLRRQTFELVKDRYDIPHFFPQLLKLASDSLADIPGSEKLRVALNENRSEELAEKRPGPDGTDVPVSEYATVPHSEGRKALMVAMLNVMYPEYQDNEQVYDSWLEQVGDDPRNIDYLSPAARELVKFHVDLIESDPLAGAVAMAYYEGRIPRMDYPPLVAAVQTHFDFPDADCKSVGSDTEFKDIPAMWHLMSHIGHDEDHEKELIEGIMAMVITPAQANTVYKALRSAKQAWDSYWEASD